MRAMQLLRIFLCTGFSYMMCVVVYWLHVHWRIYRNDYFIHNNFGWSLKIILNEWPQFNQLNEKNEFLLDLVHNYCHKFASQLKKYTQFLTF